MDQEKIGKFISQLRKNKKMTQAELAEKMGVTDRSISKWETGRGLPDASIMIPLCELLGINVNELLSGEKIDMKDYNKKAEENLIELKEISEKNNKRLLTVEVVMLIISILSFVVMICVSAYVTENILKYILIGSAILILLVAIIFSFIIEREVGYYECGKCHHRYIPTYNQSINSMHIGWTKYMKCPKCGKKSWNKKKMSK